MSAALRQRRSCAAAALAEHTRRAQLDWDDLAAWPDWADPAGDSGPTPTLALRVGALWHTHALRRCIHGPTLKRVQQSLGDSTLQAVLAGEDSSTEAATLPGPDHIDSWLQAQGAEVMLAALPSPLLRLALRERWWPLALPQLPAPDAARATRALHAAQALPAAGAHA
jgi:hypothetical protein